MPDEEIQHVGWFTFHFDDERWAWSDAVQIMHGYEPGTGFLSSGVSATNSTTRAGPR